MEVGGQCQAQASVPLGKGPVTQGNGNQAGLAAGLDWCVKSLPHPDSIPGRPSPYRLAIPIMLSGPLFKYCINTGCSESVMVACAVKLLSLFFLVACYDFESYIQYFRLYSISHPFRI
jgi:hypothetical protein